ncbi:MAG TPA: carboxymuconolactone decarboxylase family protein [Ohtaekwangia sp.]|uniref:carboxymuconolactone decarboxylase family protein n=1 Tax=Ohtaekwangia sp. TaxID=2066019 RepID=UPI002F93086B
MQHFTIPTREEVSPSNQVIFDKLQSFLGKVPNLYAYFAKNETALGDYLTLQNRNSTLTSREKEVVNLIVSQINDCQYCLAAHTYIAKMNDFTDEQILEIRSGQAGFNTKLDALAKFVKEMSRLKGRPAKTTLKQLFDVGYTEANLVDIIMMIGDKTISNLLHGVSNLPVDFPLAPELKTQTV